MAGVRLRERAYCALFASLALALPGLFHLFGAPGAALLPMYWPLAALSFLVGPGRAALTAAVVPWAGAVLTGMPLLWPPFAAVLSVELAVQAAAISWLAGRMGERTWGKAAAVLGAVLGAGRFLHAGLVAGMLATGWFALPVRETVWVAFGAGWAGVALMTAAVPAFVAGLERRDGRCEVCFLRALRRMRLPEGWVLAAGQTLHWFEALTRAAEMRARAWAVRGRKVREGGGAAGAPALEASDLRVRLPGRREPLEFAGFRLERGERMVLTGGNGCGKTTLLSALAGLGEWEGTVKVCGVEVGGEEARREGLARVGVVFENPDDQFLFPTVYEDVGYAYRGMGEEEVREKVGELLERVGLERRNLPIAAMSRGQRQRVALAGALAGDPAVLLLDEPTSALDAGERERLAEVLRGCGAAMVIATHDKDFAEALRAH